MSPLHVNIAQQFAEGAYDGIIEDSGWPLISHILRVARSLREDDHAGRIVAFLMHALDKRGVRPIDLSVYHFEPEVMDALDAITRRADESEDAYLARVRGNALARRVKIKAYEDRLHDMWLDRLRNAGALRRKYQLALIFLR